MKTEVLLSVRKVVQKSTKLLSSQTRSLVRGDAFDVVTMGMMAEIHAAQTKTRAGAAKSSGGRKREAAVNKYLEEVVVDDTDDDDDDDDVLGLFTAEDSEGKGHGPIQVSLMLDQKSCEMQLDTGATMSIMPKSLYDQQFNQWPLRSTKVKCLSI